MQNLAAWVWQQWVSVINKILLWGQWREWEEVQHYCIDYFQLYFHLTLALDHLYRQSFRTCITNTRDPPSLPPSQSILTLDLSILTPVITRKDKSPTLILFLHSQPLAHNHMIMMIMIYHLAYLIQLGWNRSLFREKCCQMFIWID